MDTKYEFCLTNSGRTHANRKCCELRMLAQAPRHILVEYGKKLSKEDADELRQAIINERTRLKETK